MLLILYKYLMLFTIWESMVLLITPLEFLLLAIVIILFITTFITAAMSTKGPLSMLALKEYLLSLRSLLESHTDLVAEVERGSLEKLFNQIKANCTDAEITKNKELKEALLSTCQNIQLSMESKKTGQRSAWQQLKDTAFDFNEQYFSKAVA